MKAIIYIRVSHKNQVEHGHSLENQKSRLLDYAKFKQFDVVEIIEDRGISGTSTQRDGFQEMMSLLPEVDCVIVYSLSRLSRSVLDTLHTIQIFKKHDVQFHSLQENIDTSSSQGQFFLTVMSALAEMESKQMSERIKSVMSFKKASGLNYCGNKPYGYNVVDGRLVPNESEQSLIKFMTKLYEENSYEKVANILNNHGYKGKNGGKFYGSTIKKILDNPMHGINSNLELNCS
jgi:site-specific DNA recombinase